MFETYRKIHLIGAGGIGVSALGKLFLHLGRTVSGSDSCPNEQIEALREAGAHVTIGQSVENITDDIDLVVYSPAVPVDNIERARARELGLLEMSYPEVLGKLSEEKKTIAVAGTHGKSTTTAMIGLILEAAGLDPLVIVGSKVSEWKDGNLRFGKGQIFVVEACEHLASFLHLHPEIAVITNIEMDHPDFYRDLAHVQETFEKFTSKAKQVIRGSEFYGEQVNLSLKIPGAFNLENAQLAAHVAKELGVNDEVTVKTLNAFTGLWRRFEQVGMYRGADIISDYAHHPTAIKKTLEAAREAYPNRRIVLCFQPHQHARTKELFSEFTEAFENADFIIIPEIYAVAGRLEDQDQISSRDLVKVLCEKSKEAYYTKDLHEAENKLRDVIKPMDVVIIMGAGDVDEVARNLI